MDATIAAGAKIPSVAAQAGDPDRAEALARTITDPEDLSWVLTGLAGAAAEAGDPDRAEALARAIPDPDLQVQALGKLATAAAKVGDPDRAEALDGAIADPHERSGTLDDLAIAAAAAGDPDRASRLATDAEALGAWRPQLPRYAAGYPARAGGPWLCRTSRPASPPRSAPAALLRFLFAEGLLAADLGRPRPVSGQTSASAGAREPDTGPPALPARSPGNRSYRHSPRWPDTRSRTP